MLRCKLKLTRGSCYNLDLEMNSPELIGIKGRSGSGKTSFLKFLCGLNRQQDGFVQLDDELWHKDNRALLSARERPVGYISQQPFLFSEKSVLSNILLTSEESDFPNLMQICAKLKLLDYLHQSAAKLSGGEAQKVCLARALIRSPKLWLFDEPLSALDEAQKPELISLIKKICSQTYGFYVSHSQLEMNQVCNRVIDLDHKSV